MISIETKDTTVVKGTIIDITDSNSGWFVITLGEEKLYVDTITDSDGVEHFNLIELNEEELLTNKEWNNG